MSSVNLKLPANSSWSENIPWRFLKTFQERKLDFLLFVNIYQQQDGGGVLLAYGIKSLKYWVSESKPIQLNKN